MRSATPSNDPVERLRQRAGALSDTGAALKRLADATDPLYKSLDENQKRRFAVLNRLAGQGREHGRDHEFHFGGRDGGGSWFHWGPNRTEGGSGQMDHPGAERL